MTRKYNKKPAGWYTMTANEKMEYNRNLQEAEKKTYQIKFFFMTGTYTLGEYDNKEDAEQALEQIQKTKKGAWIQEKKC